MDYSDRILTVDEQKHRVFQSEDETAYLPVWYEIGEHEPDTADK